MNKFRSLEESRIWVSFAGEALNGLISGTEGGDLEHVSFAAELADALIDEYRERRAPGQDSK